MSGPDRFLISKSSRMNLKRRANKPLRSKNRRTRTTVHLVGIVTCLITKATWWSISTSFTRPRVNLGTSRSQTTSAHGSSSSCITTKAEPSRLFIHSMVSQSLSIHSMRFSREEASSYFCYKKRQCFA